MPTYEIVGLPYVVQCANTTRGLLLQQASKSVICDLTFAHYCAHCQSHKDSDLSKRSLEARGFSTVLA